jgi:RimJ/RimL family protein N-acetyltransferase
MGGSGALGRANSAHRGGSGELTGAMSEVRRAHPDDVPEILSLHEAVAAEGRWIGTEAPIDTERFDTIFRRAIEADDSLLLLAVARERVVAYLGLYPTTPGVVGLGMSIAADHRGRGLGTQMLVEAIGWAGSRDGVHKIELEVWPHNPAALALYEKLGFVVEGRRRRHYRRRNGELWDSIAMGLVLDWSSPGPSIEETPPG